MENIVLKNSKKKMITDCRFFEKDWQIQYVLEYITRKQTWKTFIDKDWKERNELKKSFENLFFSKNDLPKEYEKLSDDEICQVLVWKSLVSQTILVE